MWERWAPLTSPDRHKTYLRVEVGNAPTSPHHRNEREDNMGLLWDPPRWAWRFPLGDLYITTGIVDLIERQGLDIVPLLIRHQMGDWGDMDSHDRAHMDHALLTGGRLLSEYRVAETDKVWIITESSRTETTVLLPDEY